MRRAFAGIQKQNGLTFKTKMAQEKLKVNSHSNIASFKQVIYGHLKGTQTSTKTHTGTVLSKIPLCEFVNTTSTTVHESKENSLATF